MIVDFPAFKVLKWLLITSWTMFKFHGAFGDLAPPWPPLPFPRLGAPCAVPSLLQLPECLGCLTILVYLEHSVSLARLAEVWLPQLCFPVPLLPPLRKDCHVPLLSGFYNVGLSLYFSVRSGLWAPGTLSCSSLGPQWLPLNRLLINIEF